MTLHINPRCTSLIEEIRNIKLKEDLLVLDKEEVTCMYDWLKYEYISQDREVVHQVINRMERFLK